MRHSPPRRNSGIEVHKAAHSLETAIGRARYDHAAIAVTDENCIVQVFIFDQAGDLRDMDIQAEGRRKKMCPIGEA